MNNVAPTATFTASSPIDEGSSSTLSFTGASDPSAADTIAGFHYSFACDGLTASLASTYASAGTSATTTCPFADNGSYTVKGRIFDRDEGSTDYSATVVVNNVAPTVVAPADQSSNEGTSKSFDLGSFSDPGVNDNPWAVDVNWGDASADTTFNMATQGTIDAQSHTYADGPNDYTVTVTVTDKDGDSDSKTFSVHVNNVAPTIAISGATNVDEGSSYSLTLGAVTDPGPTRSPTTSCTGATATPTPTRTNGVKTHTYADGPNNDSDHGRPHRRGRHLPRPRQRAARSRSNNVAPTIAISGAANVDEGSSYSLTLGAVTDPGTDTVYNYVVHWGDGTPTPTSRTA